MIPPNSPPTFLHLSASFCRGLVSAGALALLASDSASAEVESVPGRWEYVLAMDHPGPEQIVPTVPHHHDHKGQQHDHSHHGGDERFEFALSLGADSRYVTEGRDNLDEGGILWSNAVGHVHAMGGAFFVEVLGIQAWDENYQELDFAVGYEREIGSVTLAVATTYLRFPKEDGDKDDFEFAVGTEWLSDWSLGVAAEAVWSVESEGWFGEGLVFYEWEAVERLTLTPAIALGINQGYVEDEHDGFNHLAFQLEGVVPITDHIEAVAYASYVEPLDEKDGETLRDLFWGGGSLTFSF